MSLVALDGTPLVLLGAPMRGGVASATPLSSTLLDAAGEACIMVGRIFTEDGASHTIDTSGSSALEWQTGAVTFANAGTTVVVGLAAVDAATGPPVRAVNVANVITFDVSRSHTGGGITAIGWQTNVPTSGTKTIANGDLVAFCVQMTARGGTTDLVNVSTAAAGSAQLRPTVTNYIGAAYNDAARLPNAVITFSDGARGWFWGGYVTSSATNRAFNNTATREYGNLLQFPFPVRAYGITASVIASGDLDLKLYTRPAGDPCRSKIMLGGYEHRGGGRYFWPAGRVFSIHLRHRAKHADRGGGDADQRDERHDGTFDDERGRSSKDHAQRHQRLCGQSEHGGLRGPER